MKLWKKISITIVVLMMICGAACFWYVNDYYHAQNSHEMTISNKNVIDKDQYFEFNKKSKSNVGVIFYPGGKVEASAYNVFLNKLATKGYHVFGLKVLFNLAILDQNKADIVINNNKQIKKWYIMGHSLGGVSGQNFANQHKNIISGVIHLGSYPLSKDNNVTNISIFGSNDKVVNKNKLKNSDELYEIKGGNHAQFGNYSNQAGDGKPTISSNQQKDEAIKKIEFFINKN